MGHMWQQWHLNLKEEKRCASVGYVNGRCILVAEDDTPIRTALADTLQGAGYCVLAAADGQQALELLLSKPVDLALLDVNMPHINGFRLLRIMAKECPGIPSIILTAHGEEKERIKGLELGADDYVVKPFSIAELLARITAVLRRSAGRPRAAIEALHYPGGQLDPHAHCVKRADGCSIPLSEREYELFRYFLAHPNRIIPQEEMLIRIWGSQSRANQTRAVAVTLARLREKIGPEAAAHFENVRGRGYKWNSTS